jgi:hypothetical protein
MTPFGVSKLARHQAQTVFLIGPLSIFHSGPFPSGRVFERDSSNAILPGVLEALTRVLDPETRECPGTALVLSTHKSAIHDWQTPLENPALHGSLRIERARTTARRAVWFQTQVQHCAAVGQPCRTSVQELLREKTDGRSFPGCGQGLRYRLVRRPLYKLTVLKFPSYIVKTISSYLKGGSFEASFQTATSTSRCMRAGVAQGGIISPVLFSLYVNEMPSPSRHVELALYADDTAVIATSRQPALLVKCLETYLSDL